MPPDASLANTGVSGLDDVLRGGYPRGRVLLVEGDPGAGKTTLGLQFLMAGVARGERCLHITLGESLEELRGVAASHGWSLDGIEVLQLAAGETELNPSSTYTVFDAAEVELEDTIGKVTAAVEASQPSRVVIDSLSEFRLLAQNSLRYRHQTLALKQFFNGRRCTVLMLDDRTSGRGDLDLHSIAHGVISLEQLAPEFGGTRRRLRVVKMRGQGYAGGWHDFNLKTGGITIFPRLVAHERLRLPPGELLASGISSLDEMLGGGIHRGTTTMLMGPSGTGKSTLAAHYASAAAAHGERAAFFIFDERPETLLNRMESLGVPLQPHIDAGLVMMQQINPSEMSPDEFVGAVQSVVEPASGDPASVVVIDSLNGYLLAMPEERFLNLQLHELITYLGQLGVATFTTLTERGVLSPNAESAIDASYLADTVIAFRYFETEGEVRQAISVVKQRTGNHERTLREMTLGRDGIVLSAPLREYRGLLTGVPVPIDNGAREPEAYRA